MQAQNADGFNRMTFLIQSLFQAEIWLNPFFGKFWFPDPAAVGRGYNRVMSDPGLATPRLFRDSPRDNYSLLKRER